MHSKERHLSRRSAKGLRLLFVLATIASCSKSSEPQRLSPAFDARGRTSLTGTLHPLARPEGDLGRVSGERLIKGASLLFNLSAGQQADLDTLLAQQEDPSSSQYHRWLTPEQYAARFGPRAEDRDRAAAWLSSAGLEVLGFSPSGRRLSFNGTVTQVEKAFATELHHFDVRGERHFAMAKVPSIPRALAGVVLGLRGLDDFHPRVRPRLHANYTLNDGHTDYHFIVPEDLATLYDLKQLYGQGIDGTGSSIAVVEQTFYYPDDITNFRRLSGLPTITVQNVLVPNSGSGTFISAPDLEEAELDLEWSSAIARNARVIAVYTGDNPVYSVWDSLEYAIENDVAQVISTSYTSCEQQEPADFATYLQMLIKQGNAEGITVVSASGDSGAAGCDDGMPPPAVGGPAVSLPASIPEITAVGGTSFNDGTGTYWSAVNDANSGSVLATIPEIAWNDTADLMLNGSALAASAGGFSTIFAKPAWQSGPTFLGSGQRAVPDVALNASWIHDAYMVCVNQNCASAQGNSWETSSGSSLGNTTGGTSVSAPIFAGILALVNEAVGSAGLGNANPVLYQLASTAPSAFRDITVGDNIVPCKQGSTGCPTTAPFQFGYKATAGYDPVTGLGSVDAYGLVTAWQALPSATTSTLSASPATALSGASVTLTATVATRRRQGPPTGTATFTAGTMMLGAVPLQAGTDSQGLAIGLATLSVSTLPLGTNAVSVSYSGDTHYLPSTSPPVQEMVLAPLSLSPAMPRVPPRGALSFIASGGSGEGYSWSLTAAPSGGTVTSAGVYTAGSTGSVTDQLVVTDSLGNMASIGIMVGAGLSITPMPNSVPPKGGVTFAASGGSGSGFVWSLVSSGSGGSITEDGGYTAGATGNSTDIVQVMDSLGNVAALTVTIGPTVSISPAAASVAAAGQLSFAAQGGSGAGYTWSLVQNLSGGSITPSGVYTAGRKAAVSDLVQVVDSLGNAATTTVEVAASKDTSSAKPGCGCSGSGASADSLAVLLLLVAKACAKRRQC